MSTTTTPTTTPTTTSPFSALRFAPGIPPDQHPSITAKINALPPFSYTRLFASGVTPTIAASLQPPNTRPLLTVYKGWHCDDPEWATASLEWTTAPGEAQEEEEKARAHGLTKVWATVHLFQEGGESVRTRHDAMTMVLLPRRVNDGYQLVPPPASAEGRAAAEAAAAKRRNTPPWKREKKEKKKKKKNKTTAPATPPPPPPPMLPPPPPFPFPFPFPLPPLPPLPPAPGTQLFAGPPLPFPLMPFPPPWMLPPPPGPLPQWTSLPPQGDDDDEDNDDDDDEEEEEYEEDWDY